MSVLGTIDIQEFLRDYWQQKPLLIRGATMDYGNILTPDELAGLACEEEIESRLVIQETDELWSLEHGPLKESRFSELPEKNWTLLVQALDHWLPEVREILDEFKFLPSWRLDDVMASYAATGGSVGPHFDYYDVFLLQTRGHRKWKLGQHCDESTPLIEQQPLKILQQFQQVEEFDLEPGDMLYIPAGVAHWGIGLDDECMTWSIGFRAPSAAELLNTAMASIGDQLPESLRYRDTDESLKAQPGEICPAASNQLKAMAELLSEGVLMEAMTEALGRLSTEPRYPEYAETDDWSENEVDQLFEENAVLMRNHRCRVAYAVLDADPRASQLFVNGECIEVPTEFAEVVAANRATLSTFESPLGRRLLQALLVAGVYQVMS
ncbi:MAG: JmjC domain-containing protein [Porticoccaceae bacterium]